MFKYHKVGFDDKFCILEISLLAIVNSVPSKAVILVDFKPNSETIPVKSLNVTRSPTT